MSGHWRLAGVFGLGIVVAVLFWTVFSAPFPLAEFCTRRHPTWVLPLFERPRYTAVAGEMYLLIMTAASLCYLGAVWLARRVRSWTATLLLVGVLPLGLALALVPGYPLLSSDVFKYVFDGRILAIYRENPFLHVPAEYPQDRFYDLVYWKAVVNAHGPLWRLAEASSALVGGDSCRDAILAMKLWPAAAYLATTGCLFAMLRAWQPERAIWGTMLFAWNPLVALEALQNGHNDVVAALPTVGATWLVLRGRVRWGFVLLAFGALVKPLALVVAPILFAVAVRRAEHARRDVAWGIGIGGLVLALAHLPFWEGPATLQGLARGNIFSASPAELLLLALQGAGVPLELAILVAASFAAGLFVLGLVPVLLAVWAGRLSAVVASLSVFFLYALIGAQWFNPWYLLWLAPFAALVPEAAPRALGIGFSLLAPLVYLLQYQALAVVMAVFLPMAILAVHWRAWLGWPGPTDGFGPAEAAPWPTPGSP